MVDRVHLDRLEPHDTATIQRSRDISLSIFGCRTEPPLRNLAMVLSLACQTHSPAVEGYWNKWMAKHEVISGAERGLVDGGCCGANSRG
jgi:hypothetical protein